MANTGSIRASEAKMMSGVSREVEFQLLNAKLSEQADNIELAEEQLWQLFAQYQGQTWDGEINYPDSFSVRDTDNELEQLIKAKASVEDPQARLAIEHEIVELLDVEVEEVMSGAAVEMSVSEDGAEELTQDLED
jgi:phosphoribosylformylglycinamidine (FGAM) synthase PurS component